MKILKKIDIYLVFDFNQGLLEKQAWSVKNVEPDENSWIKKLVHILI